MNTTKVQQIINQLIEEKQKQIRYARQYPVAKKQIAKLEELGILNLMPAKFGHTDADVVIAAATTAKTAVMNAYGEGEELSASDLYAAINEKDEQVVTVENDTEMNINNVAVRVYRNALWINGGDNDDFLLFSIDELEENETAKVELPKIENAVQDFKHLGG